MKRRSVAITATAGAAAGVLGLTVLSLPAGAGPDPNLPPIEPERLVESVMTADEPAMSGTVEVDNNLGMPTIPGMGDASELLSDGTSSIRVWSDGEGRHRMSVPSERGETTIVNDGESKWTWNSSTREVTKSSGNRAEHRRPHHATPDDPAKAARQIVSQLRRSSTVAVDGTAEVAGRDAYELVLTPKPTESTVLREVRIAVDAQERMPLALTVNTHGSDDPALRTAFSDLDLSRPEHRLFQFSPPRGAEVTERPDRPDHDRKRHHGESRVVGDGWDSVLVTRLPENKASARDGAGQGDPASIAEQVGERVSGPWGEGWIVRTNAGSALLTSDGRLAVGAVPQQVLTSAIGHGR